MQKQIEKQLPAPFQQKNLTKYLANNCHFTMVGDDTPEVMARCLISRFIDKLHAKPGEEFCFKGLELESKPHSSCTVDYCGEVREIAISGITGIVGTALVRRNDRPWKINVFHRFIGKTFHQYVYREGEFD